MKELAAGRSSRITQVNPVSLQRSSKGSKGRQRVKVREGMRRWKQRSLEDNLLLILRTNESHTKECRQLLEAGKGEEINSSLEPPNRTQSCQHFDFRHMKLRAFGLLYCILQYDCMTINLCHFKTLILWLFASAAIGN